MLRDAARMGQGMDGESMVMSAELLMELEKRTGVNGPVQLGYDQDQAFCGALLTWLDTDRYTWERLRLLLNYVHERGYRLGVERASALIGDRLLGGSVHREVTLWGHSLTGLDLTTLHEWYSRVSEGEAATLAGLYEAVGGDRDDGS